MVNIIVFYKNTGGEYGIELFKDKNSPRLREFLDDLRSSNNKDLLWIIEGRLLHITPDGDFY